MPTAWYAASATSSNNFHIVTAGMANVGCASNIVEIYNGNQWMTMFPLPIKCCMWVATNVNLLQPIEQFGTRLNGGKDAASPR